MQHQLNTFAFTGKPIRVVTDSGGEPLWVAKDVAEALGYKWNGIARIAHVPEEWRGVTSVVTPSGIQEMAILTEAGLFFFLNRSDKPVALPMQKWVAGEVLPSIRRHGAYVSPAMAVLPSAQIAEQVARATGLKAPESWTQDLAHKIEQSRRTSKGAYELTKKVIEMLERIEVKPPAPLGEVKPAQATQLLNAIARAASNPRAYQAARRVFPGLFQDGSPDQPLLPGLE